MSKRSLLALLVIWNVLLTAAIIWSLTRSRVPMKVLQDRLTALNDTLPEPAASAVPRDTAALAKGRIAFFFMDTVEANFELVKESSDRVRSEGKRMLAATYCS